MCNKPGLHLCNTCRLNQGFKRNKMKCITPQLSHCKGCGEVAGVLSNKHWKQISAPLKDELREELATLRNVIKDLERENEKLKNPLMCVEKNSPEGEQGKKVIGFNGDYFFECEYDDGYWGNIGGEEMTHWMPLPPTNNG